MDMMRVWPADGTLQGPSLPRASDSRSTTLTLLVTHELQRLTVRTMLRYVRLGLASPRHLPRCKRRSQLLSTATPTHPLSCTVIRPTTCMPGPGPIA